MYTLIIYKYLQYFFFLKVVGLIAMRESAADWEPIDMSERWLNPGRKNKLSINIYATDITNSIQQILFKNKHSMNNNLHIQYEWNFELTCWVTKANLHLPTFILGELLLILKSVQRTDPSVKSSQIPLPFLALGIIKNFLL